MLRIVECPWIVRHESAAQRFVCVLIRVGCVGCMGGTGCESVAAAYAVVHVELAGGGLVLLAVDPADRTPGVAVGGVHLPQRRRDDLDVLRTRRHCFELQPVFRIASVSVSGNELPTAAHVTDREFCEHHVDH